jgi:prepilin-type N-terminal cleavage/methylation domain-containing protein
MTWNDEARIPNDQCLACDGYQLTARPEHVRPLAVGHSPFVIRHSRAFTLVELLIVISIIAILSALLLGVAATAAEQARGSRTKSMIAKLHSLVLQQYDTYKDRRAPVRSGLQGKRSQQQAANRLNALRELMKMEMPDRWGDVLLRQIDQVNDVDDIPNPQFLEWSAGSTFKGPTPLVEAYRRQFFAMRKTPGVTDEMILENQGAECLYMLVMYATADGEARGLFNESSIADTDGDGAYEFVDGWGNPISFIRWPAGFSSSKQNSVAGVRSIGSSLGPEKAIEAVAVDHDPFDMFRVDRYVDASLPPRAFRLMPLIYSRGSDEAAGIELGPNFIPFTPSSDPYAEVSSGQWLGQSDTDESVDNITNHNLTGE